MQIFFFNTSIPEEGESDNPEDFTYLQYVFNKFFHWFTGKISNGGKPGRNAMPLLDSLFNIVKLLKKAIPFSDNSGYKLLSSNRFLFCWI